MIVRRYHPKYRPKWDTFVAASANGTFLLSRNFMAYHADRFSDHSLMLFDKKLIAVFPACSPSLRSGVSGRANEQKNTLHSHAGLTYGGLIVGPEIKLAQTIACFEALRSYAKRKKFRQIVYKPVPVFFHTTPYFQDQYALVQGGARVTHMDPGFVTTLPAAISKRRMRMVKKAQRAGVRVVKVPDCRQFWKEILVPHLARKFHIKPVHTVLEIELLRGRFPKNILQYHALFNKRVVAGTTIFFDRGIAHSQYIASTPQGRTVGAVDYLFWHLLIKDFRACRAFSFGTAQTAGLIEWKEGFGAAMYPYSTYALNVHG